MLWVSPEVLGACLKSDFDSLHILNTLLSSLSEVTWQYLNSNSLSALSYFVLFEKKMNIIFLELVA